MIKQKTALDSLENSLRKLSDEQAKARQQVESYIPSVIVHNISFECGRLIIKTPYFDQFATDEDTKCIFGKHYASIAEKVAFEINDADYPTSKSEGLRFCEFMGFDQDETNAIMDACSSDEAYEHWLESERRAWAD